MLKISEMKLRVLITGVLFLVLKYFNVNLEYITILLAAMIPEIFYAHERDKKNTENINKQSAIASLISQNLYLEFSYLYDLYNAIIKFQEIYKNEEFKVKVKALHIEYTKSTLHELDIEFSEIINTFLISLEIEYANVEIIIDNIKNNLYSKEDILIREKALFNLISAMEKKDFDNNYKPTSIKEEIIFHRNLLEKYRKDTNSDKYSTNFSKESEKN